MHLNDHELLGIKKIFNLLFLRLQVSQTKNYGKYKSQLCEFTFFHADNCFFIFFISFYENTTITKLKKHIKIKFDVIC